MKCNIPQKDTSPLLNSYTPYYVQIKSYLRNLIQELGPEQPIPSELELAAKFQVSRGTVKQAVMDLVYEGRLYRKQGKGTFTSGQIQRDYSMLPSFSKDITNAGHTAHSTLLKFEYTASTVPRAQEFFNQSPDTRVYKYKRLISDEDEPLSVAISYLNAEVFPDFKVNDIGSSLYESLYKKYHYVPEQAIDSYSIAEISSKTATLLKQPKNSIVIYSERMARLADGRPCEFVESYIRQDKFKIQIEYKQGTSNTLQWNI